MTLIGPLFFSFLVASLVLLLFFAVWRLLGARDPVDERLAEYGVDDEQLADLAATESTSVRKRRSLPLTTRLLAGGGFGNTLSRLLIQADLPLTAAEYTLIMVVGAMIGVVIGTITASQKMKGSFNGDSTYDKVMADLEEHARKVGADALINVHPVSGNGDLEPKVVITATAIRYLTERSTVTSKES